jgi:hypothetical protein
VWCHTCDRWLWPWQEAQPWGGSSIHQDCYDAQFSVARALWEL